MDAFVYLRISTGAMAAVLAELATKQGAKRAVVTVGDWDVLLHVNGPDLGTIANALVSEIHSVPGVDRTLTAPVIPAERLGLLGELGATLPPIVPNACYVHLRVKAGHALDVYEALRQIPEVAGVAILGGAWDLLAVRAATVGDRERRDPRTDPRDRWHRRDGHARVDRVRGAGRGSRPVQLVELTEPGGRRTPAGKLKRTPSSATRINSTRS